MNDFKKADEWTMPVLAENKHLATVIIRHWESSPCQHTRTGVHKWNLYLIVFDDNPNYDDFKDECNLPEIPLHGGVTLFNTYNVETYSGKQSYVKIGCDYSHLYDECHSFNSADNINSYIPDAMRLVEFIKNYKNK